MQKKLVSVLMVVFILATTVLSLTACGIQSATAASVGGRVGASKPAKIIYGDVDYDADVTMKDVLALRKFIAGFSIAINEDAADVSGDGNIDMKDVLLIRKFTAQFITKFPATPTTTTTEATTTTAPTTTTVPSTTTTSSTAPTGTTTKRTYIDQEDPAINFIKGTDHTLGAWWWGTVSPGSDLETAYLDLLEKNQFTEIYFYSYTRVKSKAERAKLHDFVVKAAARGMRVASLYDDQEVAWGSSGEWNSTVAGILDYRKEYPNDTTYYGLHCDVEPRASESNLRSYVNSFIPKIIDARAKGIVVEVDLPCGWESFGRDLTYNGITGIYNIIAASVDTMCLMSYADKAGDIYGMSYYPLEAAKQTGTKVVFGIELDDSGEGHDNGRVDSKVDFYENSKYDAYYELYMLDARLKNQDLKFPYGYAIHHMKAYYKLRLFPTDGIKA